MKQWAWLYKVIPDPSEKELDEYLQAAMTTCIRKWSDASA